MRFKTFDRNSLKIRPLKKRKHDLHIGIISDLKFISLPNIDKKLKSVARHIIRAKVRNNAIILLMGAHVIRSGVQKYIIDLMKRGYISCLAMNGGGMIHDFEFALIGATTESVAHYVKNGQFGLWKETSLLNDIINQAYREDNTIGMGEAVGQAIATDDFPHKNLSVLGVGYRLQVPITIHVGMGYDIIHELPNCDGAAVGALSYNDFLRFVAIVQNLENGVVMNFGSAVMAPEIFLKALSMARNVAHQKGRVINHFTSLVCDLHNLPGNVRKEPSKDDAFYYFRPWKTMLVRTVADGGESFYVKGKHAETIPALWSAINAYEKRSDEML